MILTEPSVTRDEFARRTGWELKPEGACRGDICVPLPDGNGDVLDAAMLSKRLGMPLLHEQEAGVWCLGPESMGRALQTAQAPELRLPDWRGEPFALSSLRGQKVLLLAWASW